MNPANLVTAARIVLVAPFVVLTYLAEEAGGARAGSLRWAAAGIFAVASISDFIDGYLARKMSTETVLGQFLDPLADKLLVGAALVTLVAFRGFPLWAATVIAVREVAVSALRSAGLKRGRSLPAGKAGKLKTAVQIPMVLVWLADRGGPTAVAQDVTVYLAVALTLASGAQYFAGTRRLLSRKPGV